MVKVLLVLKWLPYPLTDGGKQAIFNGILAMKDFAEIHIVYFDNEDKFHQSDEVVNDFKKQCDNVYLHPFISKKDNLVIHNIINKLHFLVRPKGNNQIEDMLSNLTSITAFPNEYLKFINDLILQYSIQLVQIEMVHPLSIVLSLPNTVKKVFVHHELAYVRNDLWFREYALNYSQRFYIEKAKIQEIGLLNRFDAIITLSEADTNKLKKDGVNVPIYTSFSIVLEKPMIYTKPEYSQKILSFVGPDSHNPNYIGIKWFLDSCWNKLLSMDSSYQLNIIGRWSKSSRKNISASFNNVNFLGFVDDLSETIVNTTMIVPITVGSGIRMKIQEAALLGIPFISTTVGVEGLPFADGENCFIEDDPSIFVDKILQLQNIPLRRKFISKARECVLSKFSLTTLKNSRLTIVEDLFCHSN